MRALSQSFMNDLSQQDGLLHPLLERVKQDHTLLFSIRKGYINIYYRGGSILRVEEQQSGRYTAFFDRKYNKSALAVPELPGTICRQDEAVLWVSFFKDLKEIMDLYFSRNGSLEREFQQLVARENNFSTISNQSEYFVADIEFADSLIGARFDILAIQWLASQRQSVRNCRPVLIEMKYGDDALGGNAGVLKHLQDIDALISDKTKYKALLETMETQFNQLDELGLLAFNKTAGWDRMTIDAGQKPEVIFLLANHNPRSSRLHTIFSTSEIERYDQSSTFDLRFFTASFAGYALHTSCMVTLKQLLELTER